MADRIDILLASLYLITGATPGYLVLRPPVRVLIIAEPLARSFPTETPVDDKLVPIDLPVPGRGFPFEFGQARDPACAQALADKEADLNFGLIEPASMLGCVMQGQAI